MPRFYGDRIDIIIEDGQTFEDAMKITNSSICSSEADFGYESLSASDKNSIDEILNIIDQNEGEDA